MIFLIFYLQRLAQVSADTTWTDPGSGLVYDWGKLKRGTNDYNEIIDYANPFTPSTYSFNFENELPDTCSGQLVTASETIVFADGWMASCSILGRKGMQKVEKKPDGIRITFTGGDVCFENNQISNRRIYFDLTCSEKEGDWAIQESSYNNYCVVGISKKSLYGCPVKASRAWFWILSGLFIILAALGFARHYFINNEITFPFRDFWQGAAEKAQEGLGNLTGKVKDLTGKSSGTTKNYEMV
jgi:hypothetical protein